MLPSLPVALEAICETMRLLAATAGNKTAGGEVLAERYWRQGSCPGDEALATMMLAPRENSRAGHLSSVIIPCLRVPPRSAAQNSWKERDHQTYVLMTTN